VDDALIARLTHGGSLFTARFARHVTYRANNVLIFLMAIIITLDYDSVSTCRTLFAVLGSDDPRSRVASAGIGRPLVSPLHLQ
jgi:hypothetical protein